MIVTGILLSALATLAFALSSATSAENDTAVVQAQLRQGTLRLRELIGNCRMICAVDGLSLAVWTADDNGNGQINVEELVYLDRGSTGDTLRLCQFTSASNPQVTLSSGSLSSTQAELIASYDESYISLIPDAENVEFVFDVDPPLSQWLTVSFDLTEDKKVCHYQVDIVLRAWAGHLLNAAGDTLVSDDDE